MYRDNHGSLGLLCGSIAVAVCGCGRPPAVQPSDLPAPTVEAPAAPAVGPRHPRGRGEIRVERAGAPAAPIAVEVARTEAERSHGLMGREHLGELEGMLFEMPGEGDWGFWMRNTLIPLDMIFIDAEWRVVGVIANVPPLTEQSRRVGAPSHFVLELGAHRAAALGIVAGTALRFQRLPDAPAAP